MKRIPFIVISLVALALTVQAQTNLQIYSDQSVGVLSEDPASGERWSTSVFPFGNYIGPASGADVLCRTYLRFPLDGVPAGAAIQSATLYVYVDDFWPAPGDAPMSVYPVTEDWTTAGVDWYDVNAWPALGGAAATITVTSDLGWFAWDVTSLAQGWLSGASNYGLVVAAADLTSSASDWAAARRLTADDPATRPYLEILFFEPTPSPPPPTATPSPPPPPTSAPQPTSQPSPPATPLPTPTPEPILLPATGQTRVVSRLGTALVGLALLMAAKLARRGH